MILKNRNIVSIIKRSKVTDYAALTVIALCRTVVMSAYCVPPRHIVFSPFISHSCLKVKPPGDQVFLGIALGHLGTISAKLFSMLTIGFIGDV